MKVVRFYKENKIAYGIAEGTYVREIKGDIFSEYHITDTMIPLDTVRILAPCAPSKIIAVGLNYRTHAGELKMEIPDEPILFLKPSSAVIGPKENIIYPAMTHRVDYEGELGVVIGKTCKSVTVDHAPAFILGYTCFNDVTARDLQKKDNQWTRAKGFDTFAPMGPCIQTDLDPANVLVATFLNGEKKQSASTADLIFPVYFLVSFISRVMTLVPGDVIATGTPSGIGPMNIGDVVDVTIDEIGSLCNPVAKVTQ